jgi:hypothetical protein
LTCAYEVVGWSTIEPTLDLFNVFNNNAVTNGGLELPWPSSSSMGRLLRLGGGSRSSGTPHAPPQFHA